VTSERLKDLTPGNAQCGSQSTDDTSQAMETCVGCKQMRNVLFADVGIDPRTRFGRREAKSVPKETLVE
jgi:hypothetical protein